MFLRGAVAANGWPGGGLHKTPGDGVAGADGDGNGVCRGARVGAVPPCAAEACGVAGHWLCGGGVCDGACAGGVVACPEAVVWPEVVDCPEVVDWLEEVVCANNCAGAHATTAANAAPSATVRNCIRVNKLFLLLNIFAFAVLLLRAKIPDCRRRLQANVVVGIVLA